MVVVGGETEKPFPSYKIKKSDALWSKRGFVIENRDALIRAFLYLELGK